MVNFTRQEYLSKEQLDKFEPNIKTRSVGMTLIVNDKCIKCKYTDCVEVCPGGLFL